MAENETKHGGRPTGRPQGKAEKEAEVRKRGEGLGIGKVGNADYEGRRPDQPAAPSDSGGSRNSPLEEIGGLGGQGTHSTSHGSSGIPTGGIPVGGGTNGGRRKRGSGTRRSGGGFSIFRLILIIFMIMMVMNMLRSCGAASEQGGISYQQPAVSTPRPTPTPAQSAQQNNTSSAAASVNGHWNPPQTTYADTNTSSVSTSVAAGAREKYTKLAGGGKDQVTVMVYMCGTDLETNYGMATSDLNEMAYASHSDKVNIVVETGGTRRWKNSVVQSGTNQRWGISDRSLVALNKNVGRKAMTDPSTLADFIQWGAKTYPADRYILILWDHGGGSLQGYCHDENYPNGTMTVDEIAQAMKNGGVKFDFVGFDACLMGNLETAVALEPYADYLLASEETEPGTGWYYTNWVSNLSRNSSVPTTELGKTIIDDFVAASYQSSSRDRTTLSLVDLAEFHGTIPAVFKEFSKEIISEIKGDDFKNVADARSKTREFAASTHIDQIDLIHFCKNLGTSSAASLAQSLQSCIKYNRCNNITNSYGMSIYFPYYSPSRVAGAVQVYENIGMDSDYTDAVRSFATLSASGQVVNSNYSSPLFDLLTGGSGYSGSPSYDSSDLLGLLLGGSGGSSSPSGYGGYGSYGNYGYSPYGSGYTDSGYSVYDLLGGSGGADSSGMDLYSLLVGRSHVDTTHLVLTENAKGQKVVSLSQSDWDLIHDVNLNVWVDDGKGYIDLGFDTVYNFDDDGALVMEFNKTWLGINGVPASVYPMNYEYTDENHWLYDCYVPALVNGERANILLEYSASNPDVTLPVVLGVQKEFDDGVPGKGYLQFEEGDEIDLLCDYYDYSGKLEDVYKLGVQPIIYGAEGLVLENLKLTNKNIIYGYRLTDMYHSYLWTPMLEAE